MSHFLGTATSFPRDHVPQKRCQPNLQQSRGAIEAVTGAGKTVLGLAAAGEALAQNRRVLVLVPSLELQNQWVAVFAKHLPNVSVGKLGTGNRGDLRRCPVLVSVVSSAARAQLLPPAHEGLLIADECHWYAAESHARALDPAFSWRLGLSATYERPDGRHREFLDSYFGSVVYQLWYDRALADGVIAPFEVALVGVGLEVVEQVDYDLATERMDSVARALESAHDLPRSPFGFFFQEVNRLANSSGYGSIEARKLARGYLSWMSKRAEVLASSSAKQDLLRTIGFSLGESGGVPVFTQTKQSAETSVETLLDTGCEGHGGAQRQHVRRAA